MSQNNADRGDFALSVKQNDVLYHIEIKVSENVNTVIVLADFYRKLYDFNYSYLLYMYLFLIIRQF